MPPPFSPLLAFNIFVGGNPTFVSFVDYNLTFLLYMCQPFLSIKILLKVKIKIVTK